MEINADQTKSQSHKIYKDLSRLILADIPKDVGKKIFIQSFLALTESKRSPEIYTLESEHAIAQMIEKHMQSLGKSHAEIIRFQQLHRSIKMCENVCSLDKRCSILRFLLKTSQLHNGTSVSGRYDESRQRLKTNYAANILKEQDEKKDRPICRSSSIDFMKYKKPVIARPMSIQFTTPLKDRTGELNRSYDRSYGLRKSSSMASHGTSLSLLSAGPKQIFVRKDNKKPISEARTVKELLCCMQGIETQIFKSDHQLGFTIDHAHAVPQRMLVMKLMELGYLHNYIVKNINLLCKKGAVAQAIHGSIRHSLNEYYRDMGLIHSEHMQSTRQVDDTPLGETEDRAGVSVIRLTYLSKRQSLKLKMLADISRIVVTSRGGGIVSLLDELRHSGNPFIQDSINAITLETGKPIVNMIITWMVEGELFDPHDEFFISENSGCHDRDIWRDKFVLRTNLIPSILKKDKAEKMLVSGKAMHFLKNLCQNKVPIGNLRQELLKMKDSNIIDLVDPRSKLSILISRVAAESSKQVLDTVVNQFKLFEHFKGMRNYILLGRGDFASYFLELVEPEMNKQASSLQYHKLNQSLAEAIKRSTACAEDPDIINKVSIKLMVASGGDWGSDVFGLQYLMEDQLASALRLNEGSYSQLFNFLWRTKRMEYKLLQMRKIRWATKNNLFWLEKKVKDLTNVRTLGDRLSLEILHFARQFHYYILFEVVECLWQKFNHNLSKAKSFDDVIKSHEEFLDAMLLKTFHKNSIIAEEGSRSFINELRLIWGIVIEVESLETNFFKKIESECERRQNTKPNDPDFEQRSRRFDNYLTSVRANYCIISKNYQETTKKFLLMLSSQKDYELQLLNGRIDYNEYYKRIDSRLTDSMKYSRCSDIFA